MGVCTYDLQGFFYPHQWAIDTHMRRHDCAFCHAVRSIPAAHEQCVNSDMKEAVELAKVYKGPFLHRCPFGLTELVIPVLYHGDLIATVFCGQCRLVGETTFRDVFARLQNFGAEEQVFRKLYEQLPVVKRSNFLAAGTLLDISFKQLVELHGRNALKAYFTPRPDDPIHKAVRFIEEHYMEPITVEQVAAYVHLHPSYLTRLFKRELGCSVSEQIARTRMERAKTLLRETNLPIASIAINVGYPDQNYFGRRFRQIVGCSPTEYHRGTVAHGRGK